MQESPNPLFCLVDMPKKKQRDPLVRVTRYGPYGSAEITVPRKKKEAAPIAEPEKKEAPKPSVEKPKKKRKPQAQKPKPPASSFPQLAGRKSKAPVTEKTFLRMSQRHAKMTGVRGKLRHLTAKVAWGARKGRKKRVHAGRVVTKKVFGTKFGRRALVGTGLAGAAAAAALIIRKRRKKRG